MGRAKIEPSVEATTMGLASFHLWWFFCFGDGEMKSTSLNR